jgi:hypothetical protein
MKSPHEFDSRQFGQTNGVLRFKKKLHHPRFTFWDVKFYDRRGIAKDHRSPRTAFKSSSVLPLGAFAMSVLNSGSSKRLRRLGFSSEGLARTATGLP